MPTQDEGTNKTVEQPEKVPVTQNPPTVQTQQSDGEQG